MRRTTEDKRINSATHFCLGVLHYKNKEGEGEIQE